MRYILHGSHTLEALHNSQTQLRVAQRIAKIGNWEWRPATNQFAASAELYRLLGIRAEDFAGTFDAFIQLVHAEDRDHVEETLNRILSTRVPCDIDHRLVLPNGMDFTVNLQAEAVFDAQVMALSIVGTAQDITTRKQTEKSLNLFRMLLDQADDSVEIIDPATRGFLDFNEKAFSSLGYTRQELQSLTVPDIDPIVTAPIFAQHMTRIRESGPLTLETVHRRKDGSTFPVEVKIRLVQCDREYLLAVVRDISERKRAENALRTSEERLRLVLDTLPAAAYTCDTHGLITYFNKSASDLWGCTPELNYFKDRFCGSLKFYWPDGTPIRQDRCCWMAMETKEGRTVHSNEIVIERQDGHRRSVLAYANSLRDQDDHIVGTVNVLVDITERKQTGEALRESEERFHALYDDTPFMYFTVSQDGTVLSVNRFGAAQLGYAPEELIGQSVLDVFYEKDKAAVVRSLADAFSQPARITQWTFRKVKKDGTVIWVSQTVRIARGAEAPVALVACADISERKRAEEALHHSEQRYASLLNTIDGIVWEADPATFCFTFVSSRAEQILGYPVQQWLNDPAFWPDRIHPEDREQAVAYCIEQAKSGLPHDFEYRMLATDGRTVWIRDIVSVVVEEGTPVRLCGIMVDITEQKRQHETLVQLQRAVDHGMEGLAILNSDGLYTYMNPAHAAIYGYEDGELIGKSWKDLYGPQQQAAIEQYHIPFLRLDGYWRGELVGRKKTGEPFER